MAQPQTVRQEQTLSLKQGKRHSVVRDALVGLMASLGVGLTASAFLMLIVIFFAHLI